MAVRLVVAPAGHGKTACAIDAVRALPPLSRVRVLVPDQIEAVAFRQRMARAGGALGVQVQTFYGLYADVLALAGGTLRPERSRRIADSAGAAYWGAAYWGAAYWPQRDPSLPLRQTQGFGSGGMARLMPAVRQRLIQHVAEGLHNAGRLSYYAPVCRSPGFARLLGDLFGELKRARIFPEDLSCTLAGGDRNQSHEPRLAELAHLYAAYQEWLIETGWVDADGQGWLAAIALEQDPSLLSDLALLVVDGFDEFNPTQLYLLRLLADRAAETLITLIGDLQRPGRLAHRRLARARAALERTFDAKPVSLAPADGGSERECGQGGMLDAGSVSLVLAGSADPARAGWAGARRTGPLAHLESSLFEPGATPLPADGAVAFVEAQNRASEAREALRWLKARLVRDRVPPSEAAVIARDVTPYRPFLEEVAAEFGMPLRFASGAPLRANPAVAALLNLLALPLGADSWSPRPLIDALASPYLDWAGCGLEPGDADCLYDVANAGQVIAGLDQWREAFRRLTARTGVYPPDAGEGDMGRDNEFYDEEDDLSPRCPPDGAEAARLGAVVEEIVGRIEPPSQATLRERVAWVEELIGGDPAQERNNEFDNEFSGERISLHLVARARANLATAERDVAALRAFKDILRALVLADSVLGAGEDAARGAAHGAGLSHDLFVAGLIQAVEEASYMVPVEGEAILVASALEVRGLTFDSVALLGLSEGDFPSAERQDPLLREPDRAWLAGHGFAIEPRLRGDEATFFYQAVTRARRRLLICRPYLADDGQPWEASPYWSAMLELFDGAPVAHVRPNDLTSYSVRTSSPLPTPYLVSDVASEQELADVLPGDEVRDVAAVLHARARTASVADVLAGQLHPRPPASPWNGDLSALRERLAERFGPDQPWSSSRLETYAKCPFYFWAAYVMELEPRELPQIGFDVLILGSIYHLVLERLYNRVSDGDPDRLRAELPAVAQQVYDAAPHDYGFRPTPLWERQQEELTEVLRRTVEALIEVAGPYQPLIQELPFGLRERPPLILHGEPPLLLRGYIDRVDRAPDGRLRIVDYKAGSTPISARDLSDGHRLQLPLYAMAAQEALGAEVASGFYWHIGSARPSGLRLEEYAPAGGGRRGIAGAIQTAVDYAMGIGADVRAGWFMPAPADDTCPRFCPAAAFCEQYRPRLW